MQVDEMLNAICNAGMTQSEIAEHLNVHQSTVSRWANNQNDMSHKCAKKIEQLYTEKVVKDEKT